jgi:3-(3-hydroxy-phenyl)propionate hydroxylase
MIARMIDHAVVIAGGGPTGLVLAGELALAGVDVAIVERRATQDLAGPRARGLHTRAIEELDQRGLADQLLALGQTYPALHFHVPLNISDLPTRHNYVLGLEQKHVERILAEWVARLPVTMYRGRSVMRFAQDDSGVDVVLDDGASMRARYLAGCDGGRSVIRKTAGIAFPGWDATTSWLIVEAKMTHEPKWGFHHDAAGIHAIARADDEFIGIVLTERELRAGTEPSLREVSEALTAVYGTDYGIHGARWISRFTDMTRQAAAYRNRRVLIAGDAAHVQPPLGGLGLNLGVQDAMNLGWKLAQVVEGRSPESLLETYQAERHPVAARALRNTMALVALRRTDARSKALSDTLGELLAMDEPRRHVAAEISGLGIRYAIGGEHPLVGRRMPDLDLATADGPPRVFGLLHRAQPVLINFGTPGATDVTGWTGRVQVVDSAYAGTWELPAIGAVPAPGAVLIRPDGYVAWVGDAAQLGLEDALTQWFGPADPGR